MSLPNAKICPRCAKVVPIQFGVRDHCARLFRAPIGGEYAENRTVLFDHLPFPPAPVPRRRPPPRLTAWLHTALRRLIALPPPPRGLSQ